MTDVELKPCPFCGGEASLDMASTWQQIETAPKDGTWFWGKVGPDAISIMWHDEFEEFVSFWRETTFAESYGGGSRVHSPDIQKPTHWMPLPPEPGQ